MEAGLTQEELAKRMGISNRTYLALAETGKVKFGQMAIRQFISAMGWNPEDDQAKDILMTFEKDRSERKRVKSESG